MGPIKGARAGILECLAVTAIVLVAWRLFMGWYWTTYRADGSAGPWADTSANIVHGVVVGVIAVAGIGWLALRGRAILGVILIFVGLVVLSGWRLAAAEHPDASFWPIGLGVFIVLAGIGTAIVATVGAGVRVTITRKDPHTPSA